MSILRHRRERRKAGSAIIVEFEVKEIAGPVQAHRLKGELVDLLKSAEVRLLIVDCSNLNYIVTLGFSAFLSAQKRLTPLGGRVALCGLNPLLRESLVHCGLDRILLLAEDAPSAFTMAKGGKT